MNSLTTIAMFALLAILHSNAEAQHGAAAVLEANARFYEALNAIFVGDVEPMDTVWSHADDITYMGPDGSFQTGWKDVRANWQHQASMDLGGSVNPGEAAVNVGSVIAVVHNWEKGENVDDDGKPLTVSIRATNIFRLEDGVWKMIGHHVDPLPFIEE